MLVANANYYRALHRIGKHIPFSEISPWLKDEIQEAYFVEPFGWQK
jgi:hypothetical protein